MSVDTTGLEFHIQKGQAISPFKKGTLYFKRALALENSNVYGDISRGHQGQDQGHRRPWPPWPPLNSRPASVIYFNEIFQGLFKGLTIWSRC